MDGLAALSGRSILITGADGMLGRAFREVLSEVGDAMVDAVSHGRLDVTDRDAVLSWADRRPDVILHCGGLALADECERHPERAREVHLGGTRNVTELARRCGARVFYPQSVFIFDGQELPVTEETVPAPTFVYGCVKLEAERHLLAHLPRALVVRMAGFFGGDDRDKNFVGQFRQTLVEVLDGDGGQVEVGDRVWQPTYTLDLARNALLLLADGCSGVYHMGSIGEASFFDVATTCVEALGLGGRVDVRARPSAVFDVGEAARRPARMVTANRRLEREGRCRQRPWADALVEYLSRPYFDDVRR